MDTSEDLTPRAEGVHFSINSTPRNAGDFINEEYISVSQRVTETESKGSRQKLYDLDLSDPGWVRRPLRPTKSHISSSEWYESDTGDTISRNSLTSESRDSIDTISLSSHSSDEGGTVRRGRTVTFSDEVRVASYLDLKEEIVLLKTHSSKNRPLIPIRRDLGTRIRRTIRRLRRLGSLRITETLVSVTNTLICCFRRQTDEETT